MVSGSTKQTELNTTTVRKTEIPLPPLAEQERIVAKVDALMAQCDRLEAQQAEREETRAFFSEAALGRLQRAEESELPERWAFAREHFDRAVSRPEDVQALRQALLQLAVEGKLTEQRASDKPAEKAVRQAKIQIEQLYKDSKITRPSKRPPVEDDEKLFSVPPGWIWERLGNVLALVNGRAYKQEELLEEGTPVLRIQNLNNSEAWYYSDMDLEQKKYCTEGDLLYVWSGSFGPYIYSGPKAIFHYHIWRVELTKELSKRFAYYLLEAISSDVEDQAHGIMLPHMTKGGMEKHVVPLPPPAEQNRIADTLDQLMALCDELEAKLERSQETTSALLDAVLHAESAQEEEAVPAPVLEAV